MKRKSAYFQQEAAAAAVGATTNQPHYSRRQRSIELCANVSPLFTVHTDSPKVLQVQRAGDIVECLPTSRTASGYRRLEEGRRGVLNVRADTAVVSGGHFCYKITIPALRDGRGFRIGWASESFSLRSLQHSDEDEDQDDEAHYLGGGDTGYGASFSFTRHQETEEGSTSGIFSESSKRGLFHEEDDIACRRGGSKYRLHVQQWFCGESVPVDDQARSLVVDLSRRDQVDRDAAVTTPPPPPYSALRSRKSAVHFSPHDDDKLSILPHQKADNSNPLVDQPPAAEEDSPLYVEITCLLDTLLGEISFAVGDIELPLLFRHPCLQHNSNGTPLLKKSGGGGGSWYPAASFGLPVVIAPCQNGSTAAAGTPPSVATISKPLLSWAFDFKTSFDAYQCIPPSFGVVYSLQFIHSYCNTVVGLQKALDSELESGGGKGDPSMSLLGKFLSSFIRNELQVQLNAMDVLPVVYVPKPLDVDDVLDVIREAVQTTQALHRLNISDRSVIGVVLQPQRERDERWFPSIRRPVTRTKSRFGSMKAMTRSTHVEHWNILVDRHLDLTAPPLHASLMLGLSEDVILDLCVNTCVDVNAVDSNGNTPLILSILLGMHHVTRFLIVERGADVAIQNYAGVNALHVALMNNHQDALQLLLGASTTNLGKDVINTFTRGRSNAVSIAIKLQQLSIAEQLLSRGGLPCCPDLNNVTPLLFALRHGDVAAAKLLLQYSHLATKDQLNARERNDPRGSALLYAANLDAPEIVRKLLALGVDITPQFSTNHCSVIHAAVLSGSHETLELVLQSSALKETPTLVNAEAFGKNVTAMHLAAELRDFRALTLLMHAGADVNVADSDGRTPLMMLLSSITRLGQGRRNDEVPIAISFTHLIKKKLKVDVAEKCGRTALFFAVALGCTDVINILVDSCKASVNEMDIFGYTPLTFALAINMDEAAECLLHAAGSRINFLIARPNVPQPIEFAYARGSVRVCRMILELGERCVQELKQKILAADEDVSKHRIASWGDRRIPSNTSMEFRSVIADCCSPQYGLAVEATPSPVACHGSCASALLAWHAQHSGDPQHRRVSANCFGMASTIRPTAAERVAHRILDRTLTGEDAINVLKRLESIDLAVVRRGEATHQGTTAALEALRSPRNPNLVDDDSLLDIDFVSASRNTLSPSMPLETLIEKLIRLFEEYMPQVKSERALRLASTQVLMLLVEARANAARHAYIPLSSGGYEMSIPRIEALCFQALQLNREPSVVKELEQLVDLANTGGRVFQVNISTQSKWRGRNVTMLHLAILARNTAAVRYLLSIGADPLIQVNSSGPAPAVDFEPLWAAHPGDAQPMDLFVFVPCPLLCAIRLGHCEIVLEVLSAVLPTAAAADLRFDVHRVETQVQLVSPLTAMAAQAGLTELAASGLLSNTSPMKSKAPLVSFSVAVAHQVPLLHLIVLFAPHHLWLGTKQLYTFWTLLESCKDHLNAVEQESGLTALQLAAICGRSEIIEWALRPSMHVNVAVNDTMTLSLDKLKQLFDAFGVRMVNYSIVKNTIMEHSGGTTIWRGATLFDVILSCCPAVASRAIDFGFTLTRITPLVVTTERPSSSPLEPAKEDAKAQTAVVAGLLKRAASNVAVAASSTLTVASPPTTAPSHSAPLRRSLSSIKSDGRNNSSSTARSKASSRKDATDQLKAPCALWLAWKGNSVLHRVLGYLNRFSTNNTSVIVATGSVSSSPLSSGSLTRKLSMTSLGSAFHDVPCQYKSQDSTADHLRNVWLSLMDEVEDLITTAADAWSETSATLETSERPVPVTPGEFDDIKPLSSVPIFAIDSEGNTLLHLAAMCFDAVIMQRLVDVANRLITVVCRPMVRVFGRSPGAVSHSLQLKLLETKTALILLKNAAGCSPLDIMIRHPNTALWFQVTAAWLEWLPATSKHRSQYAQQLMNKVHPLHFGSLALNCGLLQFLGACEATAAAAAVATSATATATTASNSIGGGSGTANRSSPLNVPSISVAVPASTTVDSDKSNPFEATSSSFDLAAFTTTSAFVHISTSSGSIPPTTPVGAVAPHPSPPLKDGARIQDENALSRAVSMIFMGLTYMLTSGNVTAFEESLKKLVTAGVFQRGTLVRANPFVYAVILSHAKLSVVLQRNVRAISMAAAAKEGNGKERDRSPPNKGSKRPGTAAPPIPRIKPTEIVSQKNLDVVPSPPPKSIRPQTGGPRSVHNNSGAGGGAAATGTFFSVGVVERGLPVNSTTATTVTGSSVLSLITASERSALQQYLCPPEEDPVFQQMVSRTLFDSNSGSSSSLAASGVNVQKLCSESGLGGWRSRSECSLLTTSVLDSWDEMAQYLWQLVTSVATEKAPQPKSEHDTIGVTQLTECRQRKDAVVRLMAAVSFSGMTHVISAAWHRVHVSCASLSEAERTSVIHSLFLEPKLLSAAAKAKQPHTLFYLTCCGPQIATVSRPHIDFVYDGLKADAAAHRGDPEKSIPKTAVTGGVTEDRNRLVLSSPLSVTYRRARLCVQTLAYTRCAISADTVHSVMNHRQLFDLNDSSLVHRDTLMHLAVMCRSLEALVALFHNKDFVVAASVNTYGLRAWEYASDFGIIEHALPNRIKGNLTGSYGVSFDAAVAVLPSGFDARSPREAPSPKYASSSPRSSAKNATASGNGNVPPILATATVPPSVIEKLLKNNFVVEEEYTTQFFTVCVAVAKVTMPAAVIASLINHSKRDDSRAGSNEEHAEGRADAQRQTRSTNGNMRPVTADSAAAAAAVGVLAPLSFIGNSKRVRYEQDCDVLDLTDPQKQRLVLLQLSHVLGGGEKSISDIVFADRNSIHGSAGGSTKFARAIITTTHRRTSSLGMSLPALPANGAIKNTLSTKTSPAEAAIPSAQKRMLPRLDVGHSSEPGEEEEEVALCILPMYS